jgi:hypothetical protein
MQNNRFLEYQNGQDFKNVTAKMRIFTFSDILKCCNPCNQNTFGEKAANPIEQ